MSKVLFERTYGDEDLWSNIDRDICELAEEGPYTTLPERIQGIDGLKSGTFKVTVIWEADE